MEEELRFKVAYRYLEYRRLVDRYEFIERIMPDYDVFQNVYCILLFKDFFRRLESPCSLADHTKNFNLPIQANNRQFPQKIETIQ